MAPSQAVGDGAGPATGVITITASISNTGGVGAVASAGQFTVEAPSAGRYKSGMSIVYGVNSSTCELPEQSVSVKGVDHRTFASRW
jgi:hypothetical protein